MALARDLLKFSRLSTLNDFKEVSSLGSLKNFPFVTSVRTAKHYNPKFKWLRGKKYERHIPLNSEEGRRIRKNEMLEFKVFPRYWKTRPLTVTTARDIIEPYEPADGEGKVSNVSGSKSLMTGAKSKIAEIAAVRKIKNFEPGFTPAIFAQEAQDIYIKAHEALVKNSVEELSQFTTDRANSEMREGLKNRTIHWKFIESLEPPRVVQSRVAEVIVKTNLFAQVTVRFHTKQTLAIYDRFGRLMYGSEILAKDVLEYVVFEKHINNENGVWRLHAKIIPEWRQPVPPPRTYRIVKEVQEEKGEDDDLDEYFEGLPKSEYREISEVEQQEAKASS